MAATPTVEKTSVGEDSIAGHVARTGKPLLVADAHAVPADAPYTFNAAFDRETGYQTKSLLTLALTNKAGETVGVLQLVNRKDRADRLLRTPEDYRQHVRPFDDGDVAIARALAGPAGIALENSLLYADIERLFEGFIRASVQAIEARDPATAGHSFRVADFTERLALAVDRADTPDLRDVTFTREQLRELRYAALLHDFGKVGVRENVLTKAKKLHPHRLEIVKGRFRYARAAIESRALRERLALHEARLTEAERALRRREIEDRLADDLARLKRHFDTVLHAVEPTARHQRVSQALDAVVGFTFPGEAGGDAAAGRFRVRRPVAALGQPQCRGARRDRSRTSRTPTPSCVSFPGPGISPAFPTSPTRTTRSSTARAIRGISRARRSRCRRAS